MRLRNSVIGALNLFSNGVDPMAEADVAAAQAMADVATIALLQHRAVLEAQVINEQLNSALNTRIVIEQAKGMIAERRGLDMEAAFATLRSHARNHNLNWASSRLRSSTARCRSPRSILDRADHDDVSHASHPVAVGSLGQGPDHVPAGDRHEPGWPVQVSTEVRDGIGFIAVVGEVDGSTSAELRDAFLAVLGDGARDLVIDCAELTFIDSSGLGALITANRAASLQFGSVTVRNPSAIVLRLLEITGLDSRLVIER